MKHSEAIDLLAWYVAGTLEPMENEGVEAHVDECDECRAELREMRLLHEAVAEVGADEPAYRPQLVDEALATIRRVEARPQAREPARRSPFDAVARFVGDFVDSISWRATPAFAKVAIAGQFALLAALAVFVVREGPRDDGFRTASGTSSTIVGARFTVQFRDDATLVAIGQALANLDAEIVAGPTASGLYTIVVPEARTRNLDKQLEASGLVRYVAPVVD